jgi:hypothetical protein
MPRVRRQLSLFPSEGTIQEPLPSEIKTQAEALLTDLLLAVFQATRPRNFPTDGEHHGQNHPHPPSA